MQISKFKINTPEDIPSIGGVQIFTGECGTNYKNRDDLLLLNFPNGCEVAGVFTKNQICGEPVKWSKQHIRNNNIMAMLINAGNANVATGDAGKQVVEDCADAVAKMQNIDAEQVLIASTGVIGEVLPSDKITSKISSLKQGDFADAAKAIMTTDTFAKIIHKTAIIGNETVNIVGIIKGSGMIQPNMATMLGYIFTDANIPARILQQMLDEDTKRSYNCLTVDSDTSTSDMVLIFATGAKNTWEVKTPTDIHIADFREQLSAINTELAQLVVRDGEGISKFITINIIGAESRASGHRIAMSIANSPLVKTALGASDANWGRIMMAIGKAGVDIIPEKIDMYIGNNKIVSAGAINPDYSEVLTSTYLRNDEIEISVNLNLGASNVRVWTSDLTHEYISINADYRS